MSEKIIADFLEINKDISIIGIDKKIKIFSNIKKKHYRKKLIKRVEKLSEANVPLTKDNIFELFSYIYSNYIPTGQFGVINKIEYYSRLDLYKAYIIVDGYRFIISVNRDSKKLSLYIIVVNGSDKDNKSYTIELSELKTPNRDIKKYIDDLNHILLDTMVKYVMDIIKSYDGKENEI